jgi:hypothetical protein
MHRKSRITGATPTNYWAEAAQTRSVLVLPRISEGQSPIPTAQAEAL